MNTKRIAELLRELADELDAAFDTPAVPVAAAKKVLLEKGHSYRSAAPLLGIRYESLCRILNGQFKNRRVLAAIPHLPERQKAS